MGYVYIIGSAEFGWYKIGKSKTPETRVENLGILLPFRIAVIGIWKAERHTWLESLLHEKYASNRINGEWFHFTPKELQSVVYYLPESARIKTLSQFSNIKQDVLVSGRIRSKGPQNKLFQLAKVLRKTGLTPQDREKVFQSFLARAEMLSRMRGFIQCRTQTKALEN